MFAVSQLELSLKADAPWEIKGVSVVPVNHDDFFAKALSKWKVASTRNPEGHTVLYSFPQPLYHQDMVCLQLFLFYGIENYCKITSNLSLNLLSMNVPPLHCLLLIQAQNCGGKQKLGYKLFIALLFTFCPPQVSSVVAF